jgi:hypothetical protein
MEPEVADVVFVVDATGSMSDEINYLKTELRDVLEQVSKNNKGLKIRAGSMFYRCLDNSYVTIHSDLSEDFDQTIDFIGRQNADEGGDEAVEEALTDAVSDFEWSNEASARLMFLICDEPPSERDHTSKIHKAIEDAAAKGIRIIPVIASGYGNGESSLEYLMRCAALATNGTYVFLTDNSGVGDAHAKPVTDAYDVEYFNKLLPRLIDQYISVRSCSGEPDSVTFRDNDTTTVEIIEHVVLDTSKLAEMIKEYSSKKLMQSLKDPENDPWPDNAVSSDSMTSKQFSFYPNPTRGPLTIVLKGYFEELYLADVNGRLLERYDCKGQTEFQIDISRFPDGHYLLIYLKDGATHSGRILLTH